MAPAAQKKGKKVSAAAKKGSPSPKHKQQDAEQQNLSQEEEQKQEPQQEANDGSGAPAAVDVVNTAKDADASASEKVDEVSETKDETAGQISVAGDGKEEEMTAAETEEIAALADESTAAGEDADAIEEENSDNEGTEGTENVYVGEEDVAMQNGDGDGDGNLEAEGSDGEHDAEADVERDAEADAFAKDNNASLSVGKIFIGGLTRETTTEALTRHFEKYGELTDSVIMKNRSTGQPRGFGFVTYADPSVVDRVLKDTHVLDGKTVDAKRTVPREKMAAPMKGPKTKKIFVGGLTSSTTEEDLKTYFGKFGKISGCQIMQDYKIRKSRGFGFVTFDSEHVVEEVLAHGKMHEIDGKQVEIKKAEPKRANEPPPPPVHNRSSHFSGGRRGAGYNTNPGYFGGFNAADTPYYGGAGGYYNRAGGRPGGLAYGDNYGYGGGYGASLGYGDMDDGYGSVSYSHAGYASGSYGSAGSYGAAGLYGSGGSYGSSGSYGSGSGHGFDYGGGGGYGPSSRGYGSGRYHPYNR